MDNDEKISKWIERMEADGMSRDDIIRNEFVSKRPDGRFTTYRLTKSGKTKYNLKVNIGVINLDELY